MTAHLTTTTTTVDRRRVLIAGLGGAAALFAGLGSSVLTAPSAAAGGVGNILPAGQQLGPGERITSRNGKYFFIQQDDGNAVLYATAGGYLWTTRSNGHPGAFFANQTDGNLVSYGPRYEVLWVSATNGRGAGDLDVQDDGNLVLYGANRAVLWSSGTGQATAPAAASRAELARRLLTSSAVLQTVHVSGIKDRATARQNVVDTSNGLPAARSAYGTAPGGSVLLDTRMLNALLVVTATHRIRVSELAGASHSRGSLHYSGRAVDIDLVNGTYSAGQAAPVINILKAHGAVNAVSENGNHIHASW